MKKIFAVLFLVVNGLFGFSQSVTEATKISLLTGSPGEELYSTFGHSAIRVQNLDQNMDIVFNYGTFDFSTPNFYLKFVRGQLNYRLSIEQFQNFVDSFEYENRSISEQELNLNIQQKAKLIALLFQNYEPENRNYKYDFFFDNCATRIRDIMIKAYGDDFQYHYPETWTDGNMTFRNLIDLYLINHHWSDFGIDIALGLPTDAIATPADYMFLPDYLATGFRDATITRDGEVLPFVFSEKLILQRNDTEPKTFLITPARLMWSLLGVSMILSFLGHKKGLKIQWFDSIYFSVIGIVGWVVFLLWFFTDHIATKDNLNLLWAVPLHFPIFLFWSKISIRFRMVYLWIFGTIDVLILILWLVFPQQYHVAFIPLILVMLLRFYFMLKQCRDFSGSNLTSNL